MKPYKITEDMSRQEIFNIVWRHFIILKNPQSKNGRPGEYKVCKYRSFSDHGCAIGIFLPDKIAKKWDNQGAISVMRVTEVFDSKSRYIRIFKKDVDFFSALQNAHDKARNLSEVAENLEFLARNYELMIPK